MANKGYQKPHKNGSRQRGYEPLRRHAFVNSVLGLLLLLLGLRTFANTGDGLKNLAMLDFSIEFLLTFILCK